MVELQPSKLIAWVRFPPPAPFLYAHIAQAVEHFLGKEEVTSSSLVVGTICWFDWSMGNDKSKV